jgi:hypothetical protein
MEEKSATPEKISEFDTKIASAFGHQDFQLITRILQEYSYKPFFLVRLYDLFKDVLQSNTTKLYGSEHRFIHHLMRYGDITPIIERAIDADDVYFLINVCSFPINKTIHMSYSQSAFVYQICFRKGKRNLFFKVLASIKEQMGDTPHIFKELYKSAIDNVDVPTIEKLIELGYKYMDSFYGNDENSVVFIFNEIFNNKKFLPLITFCIERKLFSITPVQLYSTCGVFFNTEDLEHIPVTHPISEEQIEMFDYILHMPMDLTKEDSKGHNILFNLIHFKRQDPSVCWLFKKLIEKDHRLQSMFSFHECRFVPSDMELDYYFNRKDCLASLLHVNVNTINSHTGKTLLQTFLSPKISYFSMFEEPENTKPQLFENVDTCTRWLLTHHAKETLNHIDIKGNTALFYACLHDNIPLLRLLIENDATLTHDMLKRLTTKDLWPEGSHGMMLPSLGGDMPVRVPAPPERKLGYITVSQGVYDFMHYPGVLRYIFETPAKLALFGKGDVSKITQNDTFNYILSFLSGSKGLEGIDLPKLYQNEEQRTLRKLAPKSPLVMSRQEKQDAIDSLKALLIVRMQDAPYKPPVIRDSYESEPIEKESQSIFTPYGHFSSNREIAQYISELEESIEAGASASASGLSSTMESVDGTKSRRKKRRSYKKRRMSRKRI